MENENKDRISIANVLAMTGLAAIGVFTFFGRLMHSGGNIGGPVAWAVVIVAVLGFLLFMSIKAKKAQDNPDKWKYVEWASIGLYVVVAVFAAKSFNNFFYITSKKEDMQKQARLEIQAVKKLHQDYEHQQKTAINDAAEQFQNYIASGQQARIPSDALAEYVKGIGSDIDSWVEKAESIVKLPKDKTLSDLEHRIESWNMLDLPSLANDISEKVSKEYGYLEGKIARYQDNNKLIPVVSGGGISQYSLNGYYEFKLDTLSASKFADMLQTSSGSSALGWILYIILNAIVLLNYLVTSRNHFVGPNRDGESGGVDL